MKKTDVYRRFIEAMPAAIVDELDNRMAPGRGRRTAYREAAELAAQVTVHSKWYAIDGSNAFYYFRRKALHFSNHWKAFERQPTTLWGTGAEEAVMRHQGQLTNRRPRDWVSAATRKAASFGGYDGSPMQWAPNPNEDLDYDPVMAEKLFWESGAPQVGGNLRDFI